MRRSADRRYDEDKSGFGRAVSRILSAPLRTERIICLGSRYPKPVSLSRNAEQAAPRFPIWPCTRWGFPCRVACASRGALLPHLFTLATGLRRWRSDFLWHFPSKSFTTFRPRVSPVKTGVTRRRALRCSDFPLPNTAGSDSPPFQNQRNNNRGRENLKAVAALTFINQRLHSTV